jgi:hypothetical protein
MNPAVVGDHIRRHREDTRVPGVREDIDADSGERAIRRDQAVVHAMDPTDEPTDPGQLKLRHRRTSEHAGPCARGDEGARRRCRQPYVGVQVDPGKRARDRIAERDRVGLAGRVGFNDPHTGRLRELGSAVVACVGDDDDIELVRRGSRQKGAEICRDDGFLVVRRHDDTDCRSRRTGRPRRAAHADLHAAPPKRATVDAPPDTVSAGTATERSDPRSLSSMNPPTVRPRPRIHDWVLGVTAEREGAA